MFQPALYSRVNKQQRYDAKKLIDEFGEVLNLNSDGKHSLIDVGCGTGDVLMDFIYPILPKTYTKVVGTDISLPMIQFSKKSYAENKEVDFEVLDIGTEELPLEYYEKFDHVTSFYCLQWVYNQRQALKNIYNLLRDGGNCLLAFLCSVPLNDVYKALSEDPRFSEYMKDVDIQIYPFEKHPDPWRVYTQLLKEVGFVEQHLEIRHKGFAYEGYEFFKDHFMSVNPFIERIPLDKRDEYMDEICDYWKRMGLCEKIPDKDDYRYTLPYKLVVVYAKK